MVCDLGLNYAYCKIQSELCIILVAVAEFVIEENIMKLSKIAKTLLPMAALGLSLNAQAAIITFDGIASGYDDSGLTSALLQGVTLADLQNAGASGIGGNLLYLETFDESTRLGAPLGSTAFNSLTSGAANGCSFNSSAGGVSIIEGSGTFEIRKGSKSGVAAAPANDNTCFGYTPAEGQARGTIEIDFSGLLSSFGSSFAIDYFGFYYGSVDTYNDFSFYYDNNLIQTLTGSFLLNELGGQSGNQQGAGSNTYVNVTFGPGEFFNRVVVNSSGVAGELDNIVTRVARVPEPAALGLVGLALLMLARFKRS